MEPVKIFVAGASGLIGAEVCRLIVAMGHEPVGLAPPGPPEPEEPWQHGVTWVQEDVFETDLWREHLQGCEAVVHCIGIPLEEGQQTFERLLGDAPILLWREAQRAGVQKFVLLSAPPNHPLLPRAVIEAKMRAEATIAAGDMPYAFLRPGLVWGPERTLRRASERLRAWATEEGGEGARALESVLPLRVERVAMAALRAALEPEIQGALEHDAINTLGDAMMIQ